MIRFQVRDQNLQYYQQLQEIRNNLYTQATNAIATIKGKIKLAQHFVFTKAKITGQQRKNSRQIF